MILNLHHTTTHNTNNAIFRVLSTIAHNLAKQHGVKEQQAGWYFMYDACGRETFCQLAKSHFNLDLKTWAWKSEDGEYFAVGFDIAETAELTKLVLQHS